MLFLLTKSLAFLAFLCKIIFTRRGSGQLVIVAMLSATPASAGVLVL
nr:MAG TPA: hypothetical protein [Caudoviricetes sp.]DAS54384.1 MAG TPA: hypothetical protein [Caudoviricetes sp.]